MVTERSDTVADRIRARLASLTRAERQLANTMLENYPVSGLGSITIVANSAGVSTATVARLAKKLGYKGVPEVRVAIRAEMRENINHQSENITLPESSIAPDHILNIFASAITDNLRHTLRTIDAKTFDNIAKLIADKDRTIHVVGGRITRSLADYFFTNMQVLRDDTIMVASNSNIWPHFILNMKKGDVLVAFDIRRYEHDIQRMAEMATEKGVVLVLITDSWGSPATEHATHTLNCAIVVPTEKSWDSTVVLLFIIECLIEAVRAENCDESTERLALLEDLLDRSKQFRKFV